MQRGDARSLERGSHAQVEVRCVDAHEHIWPLSFHFGNQAFADAPNRRQVFQYFHIAPHRQRFLVEQAF